MKKSIFALVLILFVPFLFVSCKHENRLLPYVSELRCDLYQGDSQSYSVRAGYGFKEQPFVNDGVAGKTVNQLTFKLLGKETDSATYTISFNYNQTDYSGVFKLNPATDTVTCTIEIDDFSAREFTVKITSGSSTEEVKLVSIIPNQTISHITALDFLSKNQGALISHYTDNTGNFKAEIYLRILVKDNSPYWYVGLASGNNKLKAFLIDGFSGEILAIREIF